MNNEALQSSQLIFLCIADANDALYFKLSFSAVERYDHKCCPERKGYSSLYQSYIQRYFNNTLFDTHSIF